jgi:hypothetical protein
MGLFSFRPIHWTCWFKHNSNLMIFIMVEYESVIGVFEKYRFSRIKKTLSPNGFLIINEGFLLVFLTFWSFIQSFLFAFSWILHIRAWVISSIKKTTLKIYYFSKLYFEFKKIQKISNWNFSYKKYNY